ncbi:hypothetical protein [Sulfitobacter sp. 20_GPM-1509m]|uniref:hypothetical protein n=1 Tax=Sulfitobacter sp. 20_GPM-1509m TaxID=1380367 RepID=UPI00048E5443|nr:hypothetical protein [Sulfitobacter sp. 20_GPM-1509m]
MMPRNYQRIGAAWMLAFGFLAWPSLTYAQAVDCMQVTKIGDRYLSSDWSFSFDATSGLAELSSAIGCDVSAFSDPVVIGSDGKEIAYIKGLFNSQEEARDGSIFLRPYWIIQSAGDENLYTVNADELELSYEKSKFLAFSGVNDGLDWVKYNPEEGINEPSKQGPSAEELRNYRDVYLAAYFSSSLGQQVGNEKIQVTFDSDPSGAEVFIAGSRGKRTRYGRVMETFEKSNVIFKLKDHADCAGDDIKVDDSLYGYLAVFCQLAELDSQH